MIRNKKPPAWPADVLSSQQPSKASGLLSPGQPMKGMNAPTLSQTLSICGAVCDTDVLSEHWSSKRKFKRYTWRSLRVALKAIKHLIVELLFKDNTTKRSNSLCNVAARFFSLLKQCSRKLSISKQARCSTSQIKCQQKSLRNELAKFKISYIESYI